MGILSHIKSFAPLFLYLAAWAAFFLGLGGKGQWPLLVLTLLIPLRNVLDKILYYPLGNQMIDILIAGGLISWLFGRRKGEALSVPSSLNIVAIYLVLYTFFSLIMGNHNLNGTFGLDLHSQRVKDWKNFCLMPVLFFITLNTIKDRQWIRRILLAMLAAMALMEYYTINQVHMFSSLVSREKITGTFQYLGPNEVAAFFNQYTVLMLGVLFFLKKGREKLILMLMIYANIFCIVFLYSRGAYIGLMAGMAVIFLFKNKKLLLPLILAAIFWQYVLPEKAIERIKGTTNEFGQLDESSSRRILIWQKGIDLFKQNPLIGIGYGVFRYLGLDLGDTHNIYIKILAEQGILGMLIFLSTVLCFLRMGFVLYKKGEDESSRGMGLGFMACVIVMMVNSIFGDRWTYLEISSYMWIFAGLVGRLIILNQELPAASQPENIKEAVKTSGQTVKKKVRYYDL
jgi:O-antigen ligase